MLKSFKAKVGGEAGVYKRLRSRTRDIKSITSPEEVQRESIK